MHNSYSLACIQKEISETLLSCRGGRSWLSPWDATWLRTTLRLSGCPVPARLRGEWVPRIKGGAEEAPNPWAPRPLLFISSFSLLWVIVSPQLMSSRLNCSWSASPRIRGWGAGVLREFVALSDAGILRRTVVHWGCTFWLFRRRSKRILQCCRPACCYCLEQA